MAKKKKTVKVIKIKIKRKKRKFRRCPVCGIRVRKNEILATALEALKVHVYSEHPNYTSKRISVSDETAHYSVNLFT
jgi:hypothetical protein